MWPSRTGVTYTEVADLPEMASFSKDEKSRVDVSHAASEYLTLTWSLECIRN